MQPEVTIINGDIEIISKTLAHNYPPTTDKTMLRKIFAEKMTLTFSQRSDRVAHIKNMSVCR